MIQVLNLSFIYPGNSVPSLRNISLEIRDGQSVSIMGANGSGKSTLARCLNGLFVPTSGEIWVDGLTTRDEADVQDIRHLVGMVFQNPDNQIVSTTVEREIAFGMENLGVSHEKMISIVDELLREYELLEYRNRSPHYLSGGEKQILALASVLAMKPSYLILDEPTSLLDPYSRKKILDSIFRNSNGYFQRITPILITQFPDETLHTDRLIILHKGELIFDDLPGRIFQQVDQLKEIGLGVPVQYQLSKFQLGQRSR